MVNHPSSLLSGNSVFPLGVAVRVLQVYRERSAA